MSDKPLARLEINEFPGLVSNGSPHKIGNGAREMDNMTCIIPGQLSVRRGYRAVAFATGGGSADSYDCVALYGLQRADYDYLVYQVDSGAANTGEIRVGRTPA